MRPHGWLHGRRKPFAYDARKSWAPPKSTCRPAADCWFLHRAQVDLVGYCQVVEALGHAPRMCFGVPTATLFGQVFHEQPSVTLSCVELGVEIRDVRQ